METLASRFKKISKDKDVSLEIIDDKIYIILKEKNNIKLLVDIIPKCENVSFSLLKSGDENENKLLAFEEDDGFLIFSKKQLLLLSRHDFYKDKTSFSFQEIKKRVSYKNWKEIKSLWKKREIIQNVEEESLSLLNKNLISRRKIKNVKEFLNVSLSDLSDPYTLDGVEAGVKLFLEVVKNNGEVVIVGDYDADGVVSTTMLKELCTHYQLKCNVFIPSRFKHGYGLNENTVKEFKEKSLNKKCDLLIITDCGSNNELEICDLKEFGIKHILIIDHHIVDANKMSKSSDVLINWHLSKNHEEMCSCGQVFKFIRGLSLIDKNLNFREFITYAAIGTIADVMPIIGDNRIVVKNGLSKESLNYVVSSGLNSLVSICKTKGDFLTQTEVAFKIAPRINAVGRIDNPHFAYKLLIEKNIDFADRLANGLEKFHKERKKIQEQIEIEAEKQIDKTCKYGILLVNKNWNIGVVGIVSSKLAEKYNKPCVLIGYSNGKLKGSGRSPSDQISLKDILDKCNYLFSSYGGHNAAAGVTLKNEFINNAKYEFNNACEKYFLENKKNIDFNKFYDFELDLKYLSEESALDIFNKIYPYCNINNPEPIFKISNTKIVNLSIKEGDGWRLICFKVEKNNETSFCEFKLFSKKYGSEIKNLKVNLYFKFPQKWDNSSYNKFKLEVEDIEFLID